MMKKAVLFFDVPEAIDIAFIQNVIQQNMPTETSSGEFSIEILPSSINTNARLFYWHRVNDRDPQETLTEDQKIAITLRVASEDDYIAEKINQSIDYDIEELEDLGEPEEEANVD